MGNREQASEYKKQGIAFDSGSEGVLDKDKAIECFLKEAECGDPHGYLYAAKIEQFDKKDDAKAFEYYLKAAENQVPASYHYVSLCYKKGLGVETDESKALEYARLGKQAGDFYASYNLGLWELDAGNSKEAYDCFLAAKAAKGFVKAKPDVQGRIEQYLQELAPKEETKEEVPVQKEKTKDSKPWLLGFYSILLVLSLVGIVLSCLAVYQLKDASWYGLLGLFIPMAIFNALPLLWKKIRYNDIHFFIDCVFALAYIVAILVAAVFWYKIKGI